MEGWGLSGEALRTFAAFQYRAREMSYQAAYPGSECQVIELDDEQIGAYRVFRGSSEVRLVDIALLPAYRGKGIGSGLLLGLQREAANFGVPLTLNVDNGNARAKSLYSKLGFRTVQEGDVYSEMHWYGYGVLEGEGER
ncbi:acetyltransferase (GNAT) family protein [Paenibacillus cellulosilyticus]|uniref:Acetyltransferase (GNAT) family protein n=1 Tax=Paenibacillus cellulosilyticus TaxID=375489 RepID=A0A2V2YRT2_9BACL|nr:acetyltransferase (GNAT) family protein [Paenibacillus cellulosilyticus]